MYISTRQGIGWHWSNKLHGVFPRKLCDFDNWKKLGNEGWSYEDVLPYFKKSEHADMHNFDWDYHGTEGPLHVNITAPPSIYAEALEKAFAAKGLNRIDYNGRNQLGIARFQYNINFNKRASGSQAFLDPIKGHRKKLNITLNAFVTKILLEGNRTYGVEFIKNRKRYVAKSKLEIILSAGAVNSPQLLLLSGIGSKNELEKMGIRVRKDLPNVGKNLKDHPFFTQLHIRTNLTTLNQTLENLLWRFLKAETPLTNAAEYVGFTNMGNPEKNIPDIEFIAIPPTGGNSSSINLLNFIEEYGIEQGKYNTVNDLSFYVMLLYPKSQGSISLSSNSARVFPQDDINFFSDPGREDIETMYQGIRFVLSLTKTEAFRNINATHIDTYPGCEELRDTGSDRDFWYCVIRHITSSGHHPTGTTRMGSSPKDSVVDKNCMVHHMENLRVVDAGVMPTIIRGHTNAATYMIAEKISDYIKKHHDKNALKYCD
ncbi:hypothetical protein JTB14_023887 [Gonioctena quinquepunctata]|nr:hypothetical protein JTB14_023887 [Gonioctena quinquepunctata]